MFSKIVAFCAVVAVSSAGLLPAAVHYSPAAAVSSQSIVRHDQPQIVASKVLSPITKLAVAPVAYHATPVAYHTAPAPVVYHSAPAPVAYHAAPASFAYHAAPVTKVIAQPEEIMMFLIFFIGSCSAVLIESREGFTKGPYKSNTGKAWQMINLYPSNSLPVYKYDTFAYPKYEFEYAVSDKNTGDHKHHHESRDGHKVRGEYSLVEPDGSLRKVQYDADDHNGFTAIVSRSVHKHGDHAYSVIDQTRHFSPIVSGVKINHFLPNKDYYYKEVITNSDSKAEIPVNEKVVDIKKEEKEISNINEPADKTMTLEPISMESNEKNMTPAITQEVVIETPVEIDQKQIEQIPLPKNEKNNLEVESSSKMPVFEVPLNVLHNENVEDHNNDKLYNEEPRDDSEVASSYYHSKIYYVGF